MSYRGTCKRLFQRLCAVNLFVKHRDVKIVWIACDVDPEKMLISANTKQQAMPEAESFKRFTMILLFLSSF